MQIHGNTANEWCIADISPVSKTALHTAKVKIRMLTSPHNNVPCFCLVFLAHSVQYFVWENAEWLTELVRECMWHSLLNFVLRKWVMVCVGVCSEDGTAATAESDPGSPRHRQNSDVGHDRLPSVTSDWQPSARLCSIQHCCRPAHRKGRNIACLTFSLDVTWSSLRCHALVTIYVTWCRK